MRSTEPRKLVTVAMAVIVATCALLALGQTTGQSSPVIEIRQVSPRSAGRTELVSATVRNTSSRWMVGRFMAYLAPPGSRRPWKDAAFSFVIQDAVLPPSQTRVIRWRADVVAPAGFYELSVWVHARQPDGSFRHTDGAFMRTELVEIDP
jgi:hypothetical protein